MFLKPGPTSICPLRYPLMRAWTLQVAGTTVNAVLDRQDARRQTQTMRISWLLFSLLYCSQPMMAQGTASTTGAFVLQGNGKNVVLQGSAKDVTIKGEVDKESSSSNSRPLQGGLKFNRTKNSTWVLEPRQPLSDPILKQTIMQIVQRRAPTSRIAPPPPFPLLPTQSAMNYMPPPPVLPPPSLKLPSLLDKSQIQHDAAAFDDKCMTLRWAWSSDVREAGSRLDEALSELHQRTERPKQRWAEYSTSRLRWQAESGNRLEEMLVHSRIRMADLQALEESQSVQRHQVITKLAEQSQATLDAISADYATKPSLLFLPDPAVSNPGFGSAGLQGTLGNKDVDATLDLPVVGAALGPSRKDAILSWDEWYARIAATVGVPLVQAISKHGNPAGDDTVRITVWSDLRIEVQLEHGGNAQFDAAVLDAYRSLIFNPALEFPRGSKRKVVTYLSDHHHEVQGEVIDIDAHKLIGDEEHLGGL